MGALQSCLGPGRLTDRHGIVLVDSDRLEAGDYTFEPAAFQGLGPGLRPSSTLRVAPDEFQLFVRSAAQNYRNWDSQKTNFLAVSWDPFGNYKGEFLLWIQKPYKDL